MQASLVFCAAVLVGVLAISTTGSAKCLRSDRDAEGLNKNYTVVNTLMVWIDAYYHCHSLCQALATVTSEEERQNLRDAVKNSDVVAQTNGIGSEDTQKVWTGGYCHHDADCKWQNSRQEIDYIHWTANEPNTYPKRTSEDTPRLYYNCVTFEANDLEKNLATAFCKESMPFVCQSLPADNV